MVPNVRRTDSHREMIDLSYSLVIEATEEADFFGFYSPELEGFTGIGHSVEDCIYNARWGMKEHVALLREHGYPVPPVNPNPTITIPNESRLATATAKSEDEG